MVPCRAPTPTPTRPWLRRRGGGGEGGGGGGHRSVSPARFPGTLLGASVRDAGIRGAPPGEPPCGGQGAVKPHRSPLYRRCTCAQHGGSGRGAKFPPHRTARRAAPERCSHRGRRSGGGGTATRGAGNTGTDSRGEGNTCPPVFQGKGPARQPRLEVYPSMAASLFIYLFNCCLKITANSPR